MNWVVALFVGLLTGWLIEWIIDWLYWRRRDENTAKKYQEELKIAQQTIAHLRSQPREGVAHDGESQQTIAQLKSQLKECATLNNRYLQTSAHLKNELRESVIFKKRSLQTIVNLQAQLKENRTHKKRTLQDIRGIGPVIEGKLNNAGVYTFEDLSKLTSERLEEIVGKGIRNLVDEDNLIRQAKEFPPEKP